MEKEIIPMPIGYVGEVHISYKRNGKVYESYKHNAGVAGLFKFVCKALAGFDVSKECPTFIDLRASTDNIAYSSILTSQIPLSGKTYYQEQGNNEWLYKAQATIPASHITVTIAEEVDTSFRLYLMTKIGQTVVDFAYLDLEQEELVNITPGTQALVEWILRFQNLNGTQS